jgi:uncharacterized protein YmfQ (DUF2313 family)
VIASNIGQVNILLKARAEIGEAEEEALERANALCDKDKMTASDKREYYVAQAEMLGYMESIRVINNLINDLLLAED